MYFSRSRIRMISGLLCFVSTAYRGRGKPGRRCYVPGAFALVITMILKKENDNYLKHTV